jgi:hypothetical protein
MTGIGDDIRNMDDAELEAFHAKWFERAAFARSQGGQDTAVFVLELIENEKAKRQTKPRDDGTVIASGGEPGATEGKSE